MEDNFNFDKVGKRMPYKVPADFFDKITESTLAEAEHRITIKKETIWISWPAMAVAASLALLLSFGYLYYITKSGQDTTIALTENQIEPVAPAEIAGQTETVETIAPANVPAKTENIYTETKKVTTEAKPAKLAKVDKPESLDDVLADISDEELMMLAVVAETDLNVYEHTFE